MWKLGRVRFQYIFRQIGLNPRSLLKLDKLHLCMHSILECFTPRHNSSNNSYYILCKYCTCSHTLHLDEAILSLPFYTIHSPLSSYLAFSRAAIKTVVNWMGRALTAKLASAKTHAVVKKFIIFYIIFRVQYLHDSIITSYIHCIECLFLFYQFCGITQGLP